jgi:hypothetical protein
VTDEEPVRPGNLTRVDELCREAGLGTRWGRNSWNNSARLEVGVPNGRYTRWKEADGPAASVIIANGVPPVTCLGDYEALLYKDTLEIEAGLGNSESITSRHLSSRLSRVPGAVIGGDGQSSLDINRERGNWVLSLDSAGQNWAAEISAASERFLAFGPQYNSRGVTLKIRGAVKSPQHDESLMILEKIGHAILFEVDLRYDISANLVPISWRTRAGRVDAQGNRSPVRRASVEISKDRPILPRNAYPAKPLALYRYARSAANMPLLQYLAFYQMLEYYFASYFQREILDRMRQELLDPRFSAQNDIHLNRLLSLAMSQGKGFVPEKEQLRATVRACVSAPSLDEYLSEPQRDRFFTGKQPIRGVPRIDLNGSADIRDQVSDRIYDIRCRIVHAKSELVEYPDLILPFSEEAEALGFDIELMRYLAQRILINRAEPLLVP